jgi:hypothetical protein
MGGNICYQQIGILLKDLFRRWGSPLSSKAIIDSKSGFEN